LFQKSLAAVDFVVSPSRKFIFRLRDAEFIEIGCGFVDLTKQEVLDELLHVMVHVANRQKGIKDYTANQYHKKEFCDQALAVGLYVSWHPTRGWGVTTASPVVSDKMRQPQPEAIKRRKTAYACIKIDPLSLQTFQDELRQISQQDRRQFLLKYICRCKPPTIIRSGRRPNGPKPLDVNCNVCKAKFVVAKQ
jgi:hypothetical protein